jgi:hypothetical protein
MRRMSGKTQSGAQVGIPFLAELEPATRDRRIDGHALSAPRAAFDHARTFMTKDQRSDNPVGANASLFEPMHIRAAHTDGRHSHKLFAGTRTGHRFFVKLQIPCAMNSGCSHGASAF